MDQSTSMNIFEAEQMGPYGEGEGKNKQVAADNLRKQAMIAQQIARR